MFIFMYIRYLCVIFEQIFSDGSPPPGLSLNMTKNQLGPDYPVEVGTSDFDH